ncbi:MAG: DNA recombination protein RmuC [Isosphaeraceae bacterium]
MNDGVFPILMLFLGLAVGGLLGWCLTWFYAKAQTAQLVAWREADAEKIEWIQNAQQNLRETFEALASKSLRENARDFSGRINQNLITHAQHIDVLKAALEQNVALNLTSHAQQIGTLKTTLEKNITQLDGEIRVLEQKREGAYQSLKQQVAQLEVAHRFLWQTTNQLLAALKSGPIRGRWGEIQLRKIVELAGMQEHVSFIEQLAGDVGGRPDTVVHLPNEGRLPIDSKFPLQAFLEAMEAIDDVTRTAKLIEHVKVLKDKIRELSKRGYWKEFDPSPELTIMFIPIESCLMVAYEQDPEIIEFALEHKIILASPVTLLGFMKSIAYGWQQFTINKNARKILAQGKELYNRVEVWMDHYRKTGDRISALAKSYNDSVASLQSRFLPACRRFQELTAIVDEIADVEPISIGVNLPPTQEKPEAIPANGSAGNDPETPRNHQQGD